MVQLDKNPLIRQADKIAEIIDAIAGGLSPNPDAETLNGEPGSFYRNANNLNAGTLPAARFDDTAHGDRGGGTLHAAATVSAAGFIAAADKVKLDGIEDAATADQTPTEIIDAVKAADGPGSGFDADLLDSQHGAFYQDASNLTAGTLPSARFNDTAHGARGGGTLHPEVTVGLAGFMASADKTKLDGVESGATADQTGAEIKTAYEAEADTNAFTDAAQAIVADAVTKASRGIVINAYDYGLREAATAAVNTVALNDAADALRAALTATYEGAATGEHYIGATLRVPPGVYKIAAGTGSNVGWDLTLIRSGLVRLDCEGAVLLPDATLSGKTVIDCLGSRYFTGVFPEVRAFEKANPPAVGLQFGRHDNSSSCGEHNFQNLHMRGYFSRANVYNYNSEVCVFDHPNVWNYQATATSYAWVNDGRHMIAPITDVDTASLTLDLGKPFNLNTFVGGVFRKFGYDIDTNTYGTAVGSPVYMVVGKSIRFINTYFFSDDEACVVMAGDAVGFFNVTFDECHFESTVEHVFKLAVVEGTAFKGSGLHVKNVNPKASDSFFEIDAAITAVTLHDFELSVHAWTVAPTNGVFDTPAKVTLTGAKVTLPNLTHWPSVASFRGQLITPSSWNVHNKGDGLQQQSVIIADDAAATITPPANCTQFFLLAIATGADNTKGAIIWVAPPLNALTIIAQSADLHFETINNTVLTGTTGTDVKVTLSLESNTLYIENRKGASRTFSLSFLANL